MVAQVARKGNAGERTLGNGKVTLEALPASQALRSDSAHMVCLATLWLSTEKIGTDPDLPDRPSRLSETKSSHSTIIPCLFVLW